MCTKNGKAKNGFFTISFSATFEDGEFVSKGTHSEIDFMLDF